MNGFQMNRGEDPVLPVVTSTWIKRLLFLGTGTSGQIPALHCILNKPNQKTGIPCAACYDAVKPLSKNRRGCTSAAIIGKGNEQEDSLIVIDCGPSFYTSILQHLEAQKLGRIDAILLTHAHADAILGLDSLRSFTMGNVVQDRVDIYCTQECFETVKNMFPYLADTSKSTGGGGVADVKFHIIDANKHFNVPLLGGGSVQVIPLPVYHGNVHGRPFECLGFRIDTLSYISDCHHIPPSTVELMSGSQVVVLDSLNPYRHPSHFSLSQALSFTLSMPTPLPRLSLLTDITHHLEHYQTEENVQSWREEMQAWRLELHNRGELDHFSTIDQVGKGEAGGARWWKGKWNERRAEQHMRDGLKSSLLHSGTDDIFATGFPAAAAVAPTTKTTTTTTSDHGDNHLVLPQIHLTWDGMVVHFVSKD